MGECKENTPKIPKPRKESFFLEKRNKSKSRNVSVSKPFIPKKPKPTRTPKKEDFVFGNCKGEGKFGKVYMCLHKETGLLFGMKVIKKDHIFNLEQFIKEVKIQFYCSHPHIVKIYGFFSDSVNIYIMLEYMEEGNLFKKMKEIKTISE